MITVVVISTIIRIIVDFIIFNVIKTDNLYVDLVTSILVSTVLTIVGPTITDTLWTQKKYMLSITNYVIDNYTYERYKCIRKIIILTVCPMLIIYLYIYPRIRQLLSVSIIHFMILCYIGEKVEDYNTYTSWPGNLHRWYDKRRKDRMYRPFRSVKNGDIRVDRVDQSYGGPTLMRNLDDGRGNGEGGSEGGSGGRGTDLVTCDNCGGLFIDMSSGRGSGSEDDEHGGSEKPVCYSCSIIVDHYTSALTSNDRVPSYTRKEIHIHESDDADTYEVREINDKKIDIYNDYNT